MGKKPHTWNVRTALNEGKERLTGKKPTVRKNWVFPCIGKEKNEWVFFFFIFLDRHMSTLAAGDAGINKTSRAKLVWPYAFIRGSWKYIKDRHRVVMSALKQSALEQGRQSTTRVMRMWRVQTGDLMRWCLNRELKDLRADTRNSPGTEGLFWGTVRLHFKLILIVEYAHRVHLYFVNDFHLLLSSWKVVASSEVCFL